MAWKDLATTCPKRLELCDFLFDGDAEEPLIWIMCKATIGDTHNHDPGPRYWRPAEDLPEDISEWFDKLSGEPR